MSISTNTERRKRYHVALGRAIANYRALPYVLSPPPGDAIVSALRRIAKAAYMLAGGATPAPGIHTFGAAIAAYGNDPSQEHAAALAKMVTKLADEDGAESVSFKDTMADYVAAYEANLIGEYPREYVILPVAEAERFGLDYGDLGSTASPTEHLRRLRAQQRLPAYPPGERLMLDDPELRPVDCFRCQGDITECPLHGPNWRACPHAMK